MARAGTVYVEVRADTTAFARDMLDKFPDWCNSKVIEGFCRDWEKEKPVK